MFRLTFIHSTHLSARGPSSMVFEHLRDIFDPEDSTNKFSQLFLMCIYVTIGHIFKSIAKALGVNRLLILAKPSNGIRQIAIGEVLY
jgi:hypothetical protein